MNNKEFNKIADIGDFILKNKKKLKEAIKELKTKTKEKQGKTILK